MAIVDGIITTQGDTGVSIEDVRTVLGASSRDLGALCGDTNVNKWAKYKPVAKTLLFTTDQLDANKKWLSSATWWKANDNKCGISYQTRTSIANTKTAIDNKAIIWLRVPPTGGSLQPFRLTDFNQYRHEALPPTNIMGASSAQLKAGAILKIMIATSFDDGYSVRLSDIGAFDYYYFTVAIYDAGGNLKLIHSADKRIGLYEEGETVEIDIPYNNGTYGYEGVLVESRTYTAYAFMSSVKYECKTAEFTGGNYTYVPLPCQEGDYGLQPTTFLCKRDSQWASIDAFVIGNGQGVSWTVDLYGAGQPSSTTLRVIDLLGNPVTGQNVSTTIDFSTGSTQISAGDGTTGYRKKSNALTALRIPTANPEQYMIEFISLNISARAIIGHDITLEE